MLYVKIRRQTSTKEVEPQAVKDLLDKARKRESPRNYLIHRYMEAVGRYVEFSDYVSLYEEASLLSEEQLGEIILRHTT